MRQTYEEPEDGNRYPHVRGSPPAAPPDARLLGGRCRVVVSRLPWRCRPHQDRERPHHAYNCTIATVGDAKSKQRTCTALAVLPLDEPTFLPVPAPAP